MARYNGNMPGLYPIVPNRAAEYQADKAKKYAQYGMMILLFNVTCAVFNLLIFLSILFLSP